MCAPKTMLKIGAILAAVFAVAWFAFPQVHTALLGAAPFAVFLICPLAMLLGGYGMHRMSRGETQHHADCCAEHAAPSAGKKKETGTY